ncbi:hypothetical protein PHSY_005424 [Pseudozyma hubeiensis SY62]|uniref:Uncharacterized protein n=1 Tax=Pseudozyma hubeiensis (strain SY62) TaxID=1305764 RepID=R9P910_PSEHS|nr:hypothetical protein PHSY_005424 [Pseudozyma hubeiensis SY62]GAC97836.1 hypothetical protein PHSY_005424 [Pseudozyma hubeiensis SY62]
MDPAAVTRAVGQTDVAPIRNEQRRLQLAIDSAAADNAMCMHSQSICRCLLYTPVARTFPLTFLGRGRGRVEANTSDCGPPSLMTK